jgi:signal transduction histidine kinase
LLFLDLEGTIQEVFLPAQDAFPSEYLDPAITPRIPDVLDLEDTFVDIVVDPTDGVVPGGYATAPLFDAAGFPAGLLLVQPLTQSIEVELAAANDAFWRSLRVVALISMIIALLIGAFFTWWLVKPLMKMAERVETIGEGDYDQRLPERGNDEFTSLSRAINRMTERVGYSIESLKESDRIRRELVANVGHDLRTPLAAIQAHLEEAERFRGEGRGEDETQAIRRARKQAEVLGALVGDLFELSRLESAVPRLHLEPVPMGEIISDAVASNTSEADRRGVGIEVEVDPSVPIIQADGTRLLRLLNNVISNAIRHSDEGGRITVQARRDKGRVVVSVTDRGEGIAEEDMERLFDRYYRGTHARTREENGHGDGSGLGLAISKAIAEAHGGSLSARSTLGSGTTFELVLPAER